MKKKVLFISLLIIPFLYSGIISASCVSFEDCKEDLPYYINGYDVNIIVNENNVLNITETIDAHFNEYRHGIFRNIPVKNIVTRSDGSSYTKRIKVKNIDVNEHYSTYHEDGNKVIKIGYEDEVILGDKSYTISYDYNLGKDYTKDFDEFYFNIIGTEFDTAIDGVKFTITMPKEFDENLLGFSYGAYGSTNYEDVKYTVEGNVITGYLDTFLEPYEGVTIRLELPEGYFVNVSDDKGFIFYLSLLFPIISVFICAYMWHKYGRDEKPVEPVEFYPPEDLNSLEIAYIYKSSASSNDVISLIVYLASKGYLEITQITKKNYQIRKLREYTGDNEEEKLFMDRLFYKVTNVNKMSSSKFNLSDFERVDVATNKTLAYGFNFTLDELRRKVTKKFEPVVYDEKSLGLSYFALLLLGISMSLYVAYPLFNYEGIIYMLFGYIPIIILCLGIIFAIKTVSKYRLLILIGTILGFIATSFIFLKEPLLFYPEYIIVFISGVISCSLISVFYSILPKRTDRGNELYGRVLGFRNFLLTAEKDKLQELVMENPEYFYDILPYTYVLNISSKWIDMFEDIAIGNPNWYISRDGVYNYVMLNSFLDSMQNNIYNNAIQNSVNMNSGNSSGGFSGGGFGGGGGGSW